MVVAGDARRIIEAGGFYINQQRITNANEILTYSVHILPNKVSLARVGKSISCILVYTYAQVLCVNSVNFFKQKCAYNNYYMFIGRRAVVVCLITVLFSLL